MSASKLPLLHFKVNPEERFALDQEGNFGYRLPFVCEECGARLAVNKHGEIWCSNGLCKSEEILFIVTPIDGKDER